MICLHGSKQEVEENNKDITPSHPLFIRKPLEKHDPPKHGQRSQLINFQCLNRNRAYRVFQYVTYFLQAVKNALTQAMLCMSEINIILHAALDLS